MADTHEGDDPGEIEFLEETSELWVDADSGYIPDAPALCEKHGIVALAMCDGGWVAYVEGRGAVALGELLKSAKPKRGAELRAIKSEK